MARLRSTDVLNWPKPVRESAWQMPWRSLALRTGPASGPLQLIDDCPELAPIDLFPKLAIKSWQESGRLRFIPADQLLHPAVVARLASPTGQQIAVLRAWRDYDAIAHLHLFEWRDMTNVSELRCHWIGGARHHVSTFRRNGAALQMDVLERAEDAILESLPELRDFVVQFAVGPDGYPWILDINPILSRRELAMLSSVPEG